MSLTGGHVVPSATSKTLLRWLGGHHITVTNEGDGKKYHAFVFGGFPVGNKRDRSPKDIYNTIIDVPVGLIVLKFRTSVDTSTLNGTVSLSVSVPLIGDQSVGEQEGNLRDGITFDVDLPNLGILPVSGPVTIYISQDDWFHVKLDSFTIKDPISDTEDVFTADLALFPVPW